MIATVSSSYNSLAKGSGKSFRWKVYTRKVTVLNTALTGTWTEVTSRIREFPGVSKFIEYEVGQFSADSISLTGMGITWWKANVFNASSTEYIELKVTFSIDGASDVLNVFCGFVDKLGYSFDEIGDSVNFNAYTADEWASRFSGENISTQYIDSDLLDNFTFVQGLILQNIKGLYVRNANVSSLPLKVGVHTITYQVNGGLKQAKLDSGAFKTLAAGDNDIGDVDNSTGDTQRLRLYVKSTSTLPTSTTGITDTVIVLTSPATLPKQWYINMSTKYLLQKIYAKIGIDSVNFDVMSINTYDGSSKASYIEIPPRDESINGLRQAMVTDGTDLYIGVGNRFYKRTMSSEAYTLPINQTIASGRMILRMIYHARLNFLWILSGTTSGNVTYIGVYALTYNTYGETVITGSGTNPYAFDIVDYNYTGASYHVSMLYTTSASNIREAVWNGSTTPPALTDTSIGIGAGSAVREYVYHNGSTWKVSQASAYRLLTINSSNVWVDGGTQTRVTGYSVAVWNQTDSKLYYADSSGQVFYHAENSSSVGTISGASSFITGDLILGSDNKTYGLWASGTGTGLFSITNAVGTLLDTTSRLIDLDGTIFPTSSFSIVVLGGKIYGISSSGVLWQYHTTLNLYVGNADFSGITVQDALHGVLKAGNLLATNSASKSAFVYRRGNATGTPQTTGNSVTLSVSNSGVLVESIAGYHKYDLISVSGETLSTTYDGTLFDNYVLTDKASLSIDNRYIPDPVIKDIAYYLYQFFKTDRNLYKVKLGCVPLFQYEPFDGASLTFTTTKIVKNTSGVIYGMKLGADASLELEVLI